MRKNVRNAKDVMRMMMKIEEEQRGWIGCDGDCGRWFHYKCAESLESLQSSSVTFVGGLLFFSVPNKSAATQYSFYQGLIDLSEEGMQH